MVPHSYTNDTPEWILYRRWLIEQMKRKLK